MAVDALLDGHPREDCGGGGRIVVTHATATVFAATAEPALNPNQPNHSRPAPSITSGRLCGRIGSAPNPRRVPSTSASASADAPELI